MQVGNKLRTNELRTNWGLNQVSSFINYLDKGSGCITGSQYSAKCTELRHGPVEDWCRFVIGPAFLLHMFCYICSTILTQSNYHSLLFEQKKRWYSIVLNRIRKEWLNLEMLIPSRILERMQPFGYFHWSGRFETYACAGKCNAVVADHITINDLKEFHQKENKQTNQNRIRHYDKGSEGNSVKDKVRPWKAIVIIKLDSSNGNTPIFV